MVLMNRGITHAIEIRFGVDATQLEHHFMQLSFDCILWNLLQSESNSFDQQMNQNLVHSFLRSCVIQGRMRCGIEMKSVYISLHVCQQFNKYYENTRRWRVRNGNLKQLEFGRNVNLDGKLSEIRNQFQTWKLCNILMDIQLHV